VFCKYCGFTRKADVDFAVSLGIDAIGLIFYQKSKRYIDAAKAARITAGVPSSILKVGVFVNESVEVMNHISIEAGLDCFQLFGDEMDNASFLRKPVIPSYRIKQQSDLGDIDCTGYFLLDAFSQTSAGGTGHSFDWSFLKNFPLTDKTIIAGGVNSENLHHLLEISRPYGVDLSSGIEESPGIKSHKKMEQFKNKLEELLI
jgi:phosphoribosylanthranilate isomerase